MITLENIGSLPIKFSDAQKRGKLRRHPLLPAKSFKKGDRKINITREVLEQMAANLNDGKLGNRRMVTLAHPKADKLDETKAQGWIMSGSAEVSTYQDTVALYCNVEWLPGMEKAIENKEYGFISPVFSMRHIDEQGEDIGPALLFAGVTNNPHWTDQPELWEQFTAGLLYDENDTQSDDLNDFGKAIKKIQDTLTEEDHKNIDEYLTTESPNKKENNMKEIAELTARVVELERINAELKADNEKLANVQVEFSASKEALESFTAQHEQLKTENQKLKREKVLNEFSAKITNEDLEKDGVKTHLGKLLDSDVEAFSAIVAMLPDKLTNTENVGSETTKEDKRTPQERALEVAKQFRDKNEFAKAYNEALIKFTAEVN